LLPALPRPAQGVADELHDVERIHDLHRVGGELRRRRS
jgi:hypothetical protein